MGEPVKGTVMSLSSIFSPEETKKASMRVQEAISERQKELGQLHDFLNDNISLVNLVKKLPDELHHDIMVPFGKAAFFPGRLIHTNEFLVLLGEGYYAERTSKQTIEILKRRGRSLESQIESLEATVQDLEAEASFFNNTAAEAAEGLVEIIEDYVDEASNGGQSIEAHDCTNGQKKEDSRSQVQGDSKDDVYARLFSRIAELEKEELEEELKEDDDNECAYDNEADLGNHFSRVSFEPEAKSSEQKGSMAHPVSKDVSSYGNIPASSRSNITEKIKELLPGLEENKNVAHESRNEVSTCAPVIESNSNKDLARSIMQHKHKGQSNPEEQKSRLESNSAKDLISSVPECTHDTESNLREQKPIISSDSSKAFTGSIIERNYNVESNPREQKPSATSKPVSRFKLQRK